MKKFNQFIGRLASGVIKALGMATAILLLFLLLSPSRYVGGLANAAAITNIISYTNTNAGVISTNVITNVFNTAASTPNILSNIVLMIRSNTADGTVLTQRVFETVEVVPFYANGAGYTYGVSSGYVGFFGTSPTTQQVSPSGAGLIAGAISTATTTDKVNSAVTNLITVVNSILSNLNTLGLQR